MKQVFTLKNEEAVSSSQCNLLMELGVDHCAFAVVDKTNDRLQYLGYYTSEESDVQDLLQEVALQHSILRENFYQRVISWYMPEAILMPSALHDHNTIQQLLKTMFGNNNTTSICEKINGQDIFTVYQVPASLHKSAEQLIKPVAAKHFYTLQLEQTDSENDKGIIAVNFLHKQFSAVVKKADKVLLAQTYDYSTPADVLYQLLKMVQVFELSQNETTLLLSGMIEKDSAMYKELYQYFAGIMFDENNYGVNSSDLLAEYPSHFFASLFKLSACVS